jgi:HEAT repeat protein
MQLRRLALHTSLAAALALPAFASASNGALGSVALGNAALGQAGKDEVQEIFQRGVAMLRQGKDAEALNAFQACLAAEPSHEAAYELWKSTDQEVWLDLLARQGQFELTARRLMTLAEAGHAERRDDGAAIVELLKSVGEDDIAVRRPALAKLAAEHGEFAVPYMLGALASDHNNDRAVLYITALAQMGEDVVNPLLAALESSDANLRRNLVLALGYAGDRRAAPQLSWLALHDESGGVQGAAREALARLGGPIDAVAGLVALGDAYHEGTALKPYAVTGIVWSWRDGKLAHTKVPASIYGDELAKQCYYRALSLGQGDLRALAGLARSLAAQHARLDTLAGRGEDVAAVKTQVDGALLALNAMGANALDHALAASLAQGDEAAAGQLIGALGRTGAAQAPSLQTALASKNGGLRSAAALALTHASLGNRTAVSDDTLRALGEAASRQVLRIAVLVDANEERSATLTSLLGRHGVHVSSFRSGAMALAGARRMPGVDVVLLAAELPDMTATEVYTELREVHKAPVLLVSLDPAAGEAWGDRIAGVVASGDDLGKIEAALAGNLNQDREEAQHLALSACKALAELGSRGQNIRPVCADLVEALQSRSEDVCIAALGALGSGGSLEQGPAVIALIGDAQRSEGVRVAAIDALTEIVGRNPMAGEKAVELLQQNALGQDAPAGVRGAALRALGRMTLPPEVRANVVQRLRVDVIG